MEMRTSVLATLLRYVNNNNKKANNSDIAKSMLACFYEIPQMSIYDLAERCFVSPATISRFIRHLGFPSYSEFKSASANKIGIEKDYSRVFSKLPPENVPDFVHAYTENVTRNLHYLEKHLDYHQLARVNDYIYQSNDVAVFGLEFASFLSQHLQIKLAEMEKYIKIGFTADDQLNIAAEMKEQGIALIFSLEGGYFYYSEKVLDILKEKQIKIIVFTVKQTPMIERIADEIVLCGENNENTEGRLSILYFMEVLIFQYMSSYYQ